MYVTDHCATCLDPEIMFFIWNFYSVTITFLPPVVNITWLVCMKPDRTQQCACWYMLISSGLCCTGQNFSLHLDFHMYKKEKWSWTVLNGLSLKETRTYNKVVFAWDKDTKNKNIVYIYLIISEWQCFYTTTRGCCVCVLTLDLFVYHQGEVVSL